MNVNGTGSEQNNNAQPSGFGSAKETAPNGNGEGSASGAPNPSETGQGGASDASGSFELPQDLLGEDGALNTEAVTARLRSDAETAAARIEQFGEVPEGDYTLPGEIEVEGLGKLSIDPENDYLKNFMAKGKELGIGQKAMTDFLTDYVKSSAADAQAMTAQVRDEVVKDMNNKMLSEFESLGDQRDSRLASLQSTISERVSPEAATAIVNDIRTKASFEALEALIELIGSGGENTDPTGRDGNGGEFDPAAILFKKKGAN